MFIIFANIIYSQTFKRFICINIQATPVYIV